MAIEIDHGVPKLGASQAVAEFVVIYVVGRTHTLDLNASSYVRCYK